MNGRGMQPDPGRRRRRVGLASVLTIGAMLVAAPSAFAGAGFGVLPAVPANVTVGDTGVATSLVIRNISANGMGETNFDTDSFQINSITLVPSCGSAVFSADCTPAGSVDPGVIVPSPLTGSGLAGSACAGRTFTIAVVDATMGKYSFTPDATVILGPSGGSAALASCTINFTSSVIKAPTVDSTVSAGLQTDQKASTDAEAITVGSPNFGLTAGGVGTARTTVAKATPTITTIATPSTSPSTSTALTDNATITGLVNPVAGATVEFRLYGPNDATCAGAPIFTSPNRPVTLNGTTGTANSAPYTPTAGGTYRWRAFYSGDANNNSINGACNAASENVNVPPPPGAPPPPPPPPPPPGAPPPPPPPPPPPSVCTPPPGPAPPGGELCARGTAAIRGTTGCAGTAFRVVVRGRQISRVVFLMDGKVVKTLTRPNVGSLYVLPVNPRTLRLGVHRVLARTSFRRQSGTAARTLRVTFSRCARRATSPAFTG